jgi:ATP-dependent DNA helicase RecG
MRMTHDELASLIAEGESLTLEFKSDRPTGEALADAALVEAIVCLANTQGGRVLLGVEDDGTISGMHPRHRQSEPRQLEALIANRTIPGVRITAEFVTTPSGPVAVLDVARGDGVVQTSDGRALHRFIAGRGEPECRPMRPDEVASRIGDLGRYDFSAQILANASWDDFDPVEFERLRNHVRRNPAADKALLDLSTEEFAAALGMVEVRDGTRVPTVAGLLLAGREEAIQRFLPTHEAAFQVLDESGKVEFNQFFRHPLVALFERFEQLLSARNREDEIDLGVQRLAIPRFSKDAFREAVANALVHRDYTVLHGVYVKIDPSEGGLIISSPGGFVEGVSLDNILVTAPRPRNRTLADAFKRLGLVERTGRGVERIYRSVLATGRPAPSYAASDHATVKVLLPGGDADTDFVRLVADVHERLQQAPDWRLLLVLRTSADEGELTVTDVAKLLQADLSRARSVLESAVEKGLLEAKGPKRDRTYHLSAGAYARLGRPASYVHRRGFTREQDERRVLQYVRTYGEVTRAQVLELLPHLRPSQATYLLRVMTEKGLLAPVGERGGRSYTLAGDL